MTEGRHPRVRARSLDLGRWGSIARLRGLGIGIGRASLSGARRGAGAFDGRRGAWSRPAFLGAGVLGVCLLIWTLSLCAPKPEPAFVGGNGGMGASLLFDGRAQANFAGSLVLPAEFAPIDAEAPTVTGTSRDAGDAMTQLGQAIAALEDAGNEVGFALVDLSTGITVSYHADEAFYGASSIKGPYVTSVVRYELGDSASSEARRISAIIESSDNAAYFSLRASYGNEPFQRLVDAAGADGYDVTSATDAIARGSAATSESIADDSYEYYTPNQLLALWRESYDFLAEGSAGATWLGSEFEKPETSAIRVTAGELGTTWSKAGWYPGDGTSNGTTVDAGIVRTDRGDFALAVMTTAPEDFTALESVISPLIAVRSALTA